MHFNSQGIFKVIYLFFSISGSLENKSFIVIWINKKKQKQGASYKELNYIYISTADCCYNQRDKILNYILKLGSQKAVF